MGKTRRRTWLVAGSFVLVGAGAAGLIALDRAAEGILSRARPSLERTLSGPLGHDVDLGPYEGLRPLGLGIAIGPSRILPSAADRSELSLAGLEVGLAPLASLRRLQPVLQITVHRLRGQLQANEVGRYWTFGPLSDDGKIRLGPMAIPRPKGRSPS